MKDRDLVVILVSAAIVIFAAIMWIFYALSQHAQSERELNAMRDICALEKCAREHTKMECVEFDMKKLHRVYRRSRQEALAYKGWL